MKIHHYCSINKYLKTLLLIILSATQLVFAQVATINAGGGNALDYSDGMEITLGSLGDFQLFANRAGQAYCSSCTPPDMGLSSVTLRLDGVGGTRIYGRNAGHITPVSQSAVTGNGTALSPYQVETVFSPLPSGIQPISDATITIKLIDRYVYPSFRLTRRIELANLNAADTARLYWYFDSTVGGSDSSFGYLDGTSVGTQHPIALEKLEYQQSSAGTAWGNYYSGQYNIPPILISNPGDLDNSIIAMTLDAGLGVQWNVPAGSTTYAGAADLVYIPSLLTARETYTPRSILLNTQSRMSISLSNLNIADTPATFTYTLPTGVSVATVPNLQNTCAPGGGTITASGNTITVTGLVIQGIGAGTTAYTCSINLDVLGAQLGTYWASFISSDLSVGRAPVFTTENSLEVLPIVSMTGVHTPSLLTIGDSSDLVLTLTNRATTPQLAQAFRFGVNDPDFMPTQPLSISSTCSNTPNVVLNTDILEFTQLNLPAAPSTTVPSTCTVRVKFGPATIKGYFNTYFYDSLSGIVFEGNTPEVQVISNISASPRFIPNFTSTPQTVRFEVTVLNNTPLEVSNGNFTYDFAPYGLSLAVPDNLTSTCGGTTSVTTTTNTLSVSNLTLPANQSTPALCTIGVDVAVPNMGWFSVAFNSPDDSVTQTQSAELYAENNIFDYAVGANSLTNSVVATGQNAMHTIQLFSRSPTAITNLSLRIDAYTAGLTLPTAAQIASNCPAGMVFNIQPTYIEISNITLNPAPLGEEYTCTISMPFSASQPGIYQTYTNAISGPWYTMLNASQQLRVMPNFFASVTGVENIPAMPWAALTFLSILLAGLTQYRKR